MHWLHQTKMMGPQKFKKKLNVKKFLDYFFFKLTILTFNNTQNALVIYDLICFVAVQ